MLPVDVVSRGGRARDLPPPARGFQRTGTALGGARYALLSYFTPLAYGPLPMD